MPSTVFPEMTLRSAATVPPTRSFVVPALTRLTPTRLPNPAAVVPARFVPRKFPAMTLFAESPARIAAPGERLMQSPRIVLPEAPDWRSNVSPGALAAVTSITGPVRGTESGCDVVSRMRGLVMAGRLDPRVMRYQLRAVPAG